MQSGLQASSMAAFGSVSSSAIFPRYFTHDACPCACRDHHRRGSLWPVACKQVGGEPLQNMNLSPTEVS